jgi:YihY family inner membrane protein
MSTANEIPETWRLQGDDAKETLRATGRVRLLKDALRRLRSADGFSHARSIAFLLALLFIEGVIAAVGLASVLASGGVSDGIVRGLQAAVPGPAGRVLTDAVAQAHRAGTGSHYLPLILGVVAAVVTGTTLLGQFERGLNRIYGVEQDRPTFRKYGLAFLLLCSAGVLATVGFACLALGHAIGVGVRDGAWRTAWSVARWPMGLLFVTGAMVLVFRASPRRHQPGWSWLSMGALLAVVLWVIVTAGFDLFFSVNTTFGTTYGPLAGIVALLLWCYGSSAAVLYGVAVAAQLEAVRAGAPSPRNPAKARLPDTRGVPASISTGS